MTDFISVEKVYGILDAAITPISRKERLPLRDALGCVLAESLYAANDVPAFNNSAMDGFAFPGSSLPAHGLARLPVEGVSYAGVPYCGANRFARHDGGSGARRSRHGYSL